MPNEVLPPVEPTTNKESWDNAEWKGEIEFSENFPKTASFTTRKLMYPDEKEVQGWTPREVPWIELAAIAVILGLMFLVTL